MRIKLFVDTVGTVCAPCNKPLSSNCTQESLFIETAIITTLVIPVNKKKYPIWKNLEKKILNLLFTIFSNCFSYGNNKDTLLWSQINISNLHSSWRKRHCYLKIISFRSRYTQFRQKKFLTLGSTFYSSPFIIVTTGFEHGVF